MYCSRPVQRSAGPTVRIITRAPHRAASYYPSFPSTISPFYTRPSPSFDPFRGLERILEDITSPQFPFAPQQQLTRQASFQPRFDVRENNGTYELRGEVPGVESQNLEVEFSDAQTLVVRGRTETDSSSGMGSSEKGKEHEHADTAAADNTTTAEVEADDSDAASIHSTGSYQKPSVEDATELAANVDTAASTEAQNTPASTPGADQQQRQQVAEAPKQEQQQQGHYWVSERSTGSFQRVFKFPHRVDQEAVTASLKNGILRVVVPKAARPEARRIQVE